MNIRPSAAIRQNYNEIAEMCRKTAEPIFLTKNGEGDLVVMDIETYNRREKMLGLREELLAVEEDRMAGRTGTTVDELDAYLDDIIEEVQSMADNKTYKVIVSDRAKQMLGTHIRFMAQVNKDAARDKKKEIVTALRSLSKMPQRFPFFEEMYIPPNKYHKMFVEKWYLILYQIQDDTVYVDYILDCRRDYSWLVH